MSDKNIYQRMSDITTELKTVFKNLTVKVSETNQYKAVSEKDVLDAVKPVEAKHGIYSYPIDREILREETQERETRSGIRKELFTRIRTIYRFINVDKPEEFIDTITYADGIDSGDKGMGKAMTYADKYALMKAYKISTGEDPDQEPSTELKSQGQKKTYKATEKQLGLFTSLYSQEEVEKIMAHYKVSNLSDLDGSTVSKYISDRKVK